MKPMLASLCLSAFLLVPVAVPRARAATPAAATAAPKVFAAPQKEGTRATCPITGEEFTIGKNTVHAEYQGKHVYFCCPGCKQSFDKDPAKYTK